MKKTQELISIVYILFATIVVGFGFVTNYSYANNDCDLVKVDMDGNFKILDDTIYKEYENILPKDAMRQALINLKNFCCKENLMGGVANNDTCTKDSTVNKNNIFPSSAYLYDHIIDVSMRRLDAKVENKNGADLIYGLEPEAKGKEWRDFIMKQANSKNGSIPLQISTKFRENREEGLNSLAAWNPSHDLPRKKEIFENYENWVLVDKYKGVCETSIYLYLNLYPETDKTSLNTAYQNCEDMSNRRIKKEFRYTKSILMQKGNRLLFNNVKSYLDTYFVQDKLVALQQLIFNIKNTFNEINKAIRGIVSDCSS